LEYTPKRVTKVSHQNEICKSKNSAQKAMIQLRSCSKCCPLSQTCVLRTSTLAAIDRRPWRCCASVDHWRRWGAVLKQYLFSSVSMLK